MQSTDTPFIPNQVQSERTHLVIPSFPHWIEPTVEYLRQKAVLSGACQETRAAKLLVALLEALSNSVIHGNLELSSDLKERGDDSFARALAERATDPVLSARHVDIRVEYDGEACHWIITDEGAGFDVDRVLKRCLSQDPEATLTSGRGILMMHSFLDRIRYEMGGRRLIMTLSRDSGLEKRRERRVPIHLPFRVAPLKADGTPDWSAAQDAISRDFSANGISLIQDGLTTGQHIFIGINMGGETIALPAEVRHCRTIAPGSVELGCEFRLSRGREPSPETANSEEQEALHQAIHAVLATHQAPQLPNDERRSHPRVLFNRPVWLAMDGRKERVTAYARDMSKGGMAVIARIPLALGPGVVYLPREGDPPLAIRVHLVRCNKVQEGFYDIGLQFLRLAGF